jgi:hypothetical protein
MPSGRARLAGWIHTTGDLILLHGCFLVACVPVVTVVPAAFSLQRSMEDLLLRGDTTIASTYRKHFLWAVRRFTLVSVVVLVYAALLVVSLYLWASFTGVVKIAGLCLVGGLGLLSTGLYLCALAWSGTPGGRKTVDAHDPDRTGDTWRTLWHGARDRFAAQPVPVIACVAVVWVWLLILLRAPGLGVFGLGLVPALLAYWLNRIALAADPRPRPG